jgi:Kdo2-lipid IVA lauroyltransferase/acyltransferase
VLTRILKPFLLASDLLLCFLALLLGVPLWFLPWDAAAHMGRFYGYCAFLVWPRATRVAMINLRRAYGESMDYRKAKTNARQVFGNLGQSIAEGIQFSRRFLIGGSAWERLYRPEDPELEHRVRADPRPKIFVTGHLGSWEATIMMASRRVGANSAVIARRVDNPFLNSVVQILRMDHHSRWIDKRGAVFECLRRLGAGDSVALLMDENGGWRGSYVNFFGRPASTRKTAALLSLCTGAPIVVGAAVRGCDDVKFLFKLAVIDPRCFPTGPESILKITQQIMTVYEGWVRAAPLQWRWIHWRWKNRPDGSEETYTRRDLNACFVQPQTHPKQNAGVCQRMTPGLDPVKRFTTGTQRTQDDF